MKYVEFQPGEIYGRLEVVKDLGIFVKQGTKTKVHYVECMCRCGNPEPVIVAAPKLKSGYTQSCGCLHKEMVVEANKKYNQYYEYDDIVFVKYTNCDEYFICDKEDWDYLKQYSWRKNDNGYAVRSVKKSKDKDYPHTEYFHRIVTNCPDDLVPDHKYQVSNGVCDNRKSNLEIKTQKENTYNTKIYAHNTSGYRGVTWSQEKQKWTAQIQVDGKHKFIGYFDDKKEAAKAHEEKRRMYFGDKYAKEIA